MSELTELEPFREQGLFDTIVGSFRQVLLALPDKRKGKNTRYRKFRYSSSETRRNILSHDFMPGVINQSGV